MKKQEINLNGSSLSIETGQVARQSSGSVIVRHGETAILVAVNAAKQAREDVDWFPLQVEYRERHYAGGKIPGGFFKREARPSEHEILTSRLTDRPIRPLFPKSFRNSNRFGQSYLSIMVKRGHEVDLEYSKETILKKLNSYLGYNAVEKLKFISFEGEDIEKKEKISKDATNNEYKEKISKIKNDKVKNSLIELSKYFKKK